MNKMSRFFRQQGDTDSDSDESEDELLSSGDEDAAPSKPAATSARPAMSRFLRSDAQPGEPEESSSDSDESDDDSEVDKKKAKPPKSIIFILQYICKVLKLLLKGKKNVGKRFSF